MKIRSDFVTNSSSSSFIIAKRLLCSKEEITDHLESMRKEIAEFLKSWSYEGSDQQVDDIILYVTNRLFWMPTRLREDGWIECFTELSNFDSDIYETFIYAFWSKLSTMNFDVKKVPDY